MFVHPPPHTHTNHEVVGNGPSLIVAAPTASTGGASASVVKDTSRGLSSRGSESPARGNGTSAVDTRENDGMRRDQSPASPRLHRVRGRDPGRERDPGRRGREM